MSEKETTIDVADPSVVQKLAGTNEKHFKYLNEELAIRIGCRGGTIHIAGPEANVDLAGKLIDGLVPILRKKRTLSLFDVEHALIALRVDDSISLSSLFLDVIIKARSGREVLPRGFGQKKYVDAIRTNTLTFGVGPAGTGKTFLAIAQAVAAWQSEKVERIVLTRPAVEAGERLGFLPGDLEAKVNPYLRPVFDALYELIGFEETTRAMERTDIEIAPLAFMRGRTLARAFVILDEAQNTTPAQMKMFLTRIGHGTKVVVTGDPSQVDLPRGQRSGLRDALDRLHGVKDVAICPFAAVDVVRHRLVRRIIAAYEQP